jgi:hypothetical protein
VCRPGDEWGVSRRGCGYELTGETGPHEKVKTREARLQLRVYNREQLGNGPPQMDPPRPRVPLGSGGESPTGWSEKTGEEDAT